MKKYLNLIYACILCCGLTACDVEDAIKGTKEVPAKIDATNGNMNRMLDEMKKTTAGVHDQSLLIPMENLIKEENHDSLAPVPFKLMPFGKKFAEAATAAELMDLTYLWLKEVDESMPAKAIDEATGEELSYTKREIAHINNEKIARLTALQVIAGFTPQQIVNEIVAKNIVGASDQGSRRFEQTAYAFLMLRVMFIRDVLLQESLLASPLDNVGKVEEAIKYAVQIDSIARYRFANQVEFKSRGLVDVAGRQLPEDMQPAEKLDLSVAAILWRRISEKAQADLRIVQREVGSNSQEDKNIYDQELKRSQDDLRIISDYVQSWADRTQVDRP
ncbi:MAG: hypothetical protein ACKOX6_07610 [Bdellovibrio sp.]